MVFREINLNYDVMKQDLQTRIDKYVQYVIAQVDKSNHSKDEMKEDLLSC